jgi:hypothetical protein
VRHQPVSDGKINAEAELASVAVGEVGGCTPHTPEVQQARRVAYWPAHLYGLAAILLQLGLSPG